MPGMPITNGGPAGRSLLVAPTLSSTPQKRTLGDAGSSQAIYEVRAVIDPANANDAMLQLRGVLDDCIVLGRGDTEPVWLEAAATTVYVVFVGTAINGNVVTPAASEAQFTSAMLALTFDPADEVMRIDLKTLDVLAAAGTLDARYMTLICEGYGNA